MGKTFWAVIMVVVCGYHIHKKIQAHNLPPLHDTPYLVVYGRDSCGLTQNTLRQLRGAGIAHHYEIVDDPQVAAVLHARMRQIGISTRSYMLPVVDLNRKISVRPANDKMIAQARKLGLYRPAGSSGY